MREYITKDVDLLVQDNADNRERLACALRDLKALAGGTDRPPVSGDDFTHGNTQWETDAGPIDVLVKATGPYETILIYADIEYRQEFFALDDGQMAPVASLNDVIRMKEAADRYKDHQALPELRRLRGDPHPEHPTGYDPFAAFDIEDDAD